MRRISILIVLAVVFAFSSSASAESFEGKSSGITVEYEIDLPDGYAKSKKSYPVIMFFTAGAGRITHSSNAL